MLPTVGFAANETQMPFVVKTKLFSTKATSNICSDRKPRAKASVYLEGPVFPTENSSCHVACHK